LCYRELAADFTLGVTDDKASTGPDVTMKPVSVHGHAFFAKGSLPGEHMGVDGIDQGAVKIKY
jgi:hypothetical protein